MRINPRSWSGAAPTSRNRVNVLPQSSVTGPPIYRPDNALQRKTATPAPFVAGCAGQLPMRPQTVRNGPPVYRPQPLSIRVPAASPGTVQRSCNGTPPPPPAVLRHAAVQRMVNNCDWCNQPGCNKGSICGSHSSNVGIYAGRKADQQHLSNTYGQKVSGATHQMEHPFGYAVLAGPQHSGKRASNPTTRQIEQTAPAYHEELQQHRKHEGTGNVTEKQESGLNSDEYRRWTRTAMEDSNPEIAMAINQMTYAHQKLPHNPTSRAQANDSYNRMVRTMGPIPLGTTTGVQQVPVTDDQKFDMLCYRFEVTFGRYPDEMEQLQIIAQHGLNVSWM